MKKLIVALLAVIITVLGVVGFCILISIPEETKEEEKPLTKWLSVDKDKIVNSRGEAVQLVGISTHGIQWFSDLYNAESIAALKEEFGINLFRIAMYVDPNDKGYVANHALKEKVYELVDACIALDMYVTIDWHVLNEKNPQIYQTEAVEFFSEVSAKYADVPYVIYEICNEPNGEVDWDNNIRPYAVEVIAKIREHSKDSLIIVGTPDWSKEFVDVSFNPLEGQNIAYALHFYAGSHNNTLRERADYFRGKGFAIFVSECGATDITGDGQIYEDAFRNWVDYMDERKISWVYWSFANKDEASAILKKDAVPFGEKSGGDSDEPVPLFSDYLSPSGVFLRDLMKRYQ